MTDPMRLVESGTTEQMTDAFIAFDGPFVELYDIYLGETEYFALDHYVIDELDDDTQRRMFLHFVFLSEGILE